MKAETEHCLNSVNYCTRCPWQGVIWGGCRVASARWGWGYPMPHMARSSCLQPTHHRAWLSPSAKMVVPLWKHTYERGKTPVREEGNENQSEKQERKQQGQRRRREEGAPRQQIFPCSQWRAHDRGLDVSWRNCGLWDSPHWRGEEREREGRSDREKIPVYWP